MPRHLRRLLLSVLFLVVAVVVYVLFGLYLLLGLIFLNIVCWVFSPTARKRGWGAESRLAAYLSPPPIIDAAKRASQPTPDPRRARFD